MNLSRRLPALLLFTGVLGSAIATSHYLDHSRFDENERLRAQLDLAANLAVDRLRDPVLRGNAERAHAVLVELVARAPVSAAHVYGLDGTALTSWFRDEPHVSEFAPGQAPESTPQYAIRTGRRPIGQLVVEPQRSEGGASLSSLLVLGGTPFLIGLLGCLGILGSRKRPADDPGTGRIKELEGELSEARAALEGASRTKSMFLANMSHEIRTPLNGVLGMTDLLLGTSLDTRQRKFATTVRGSAESLLNIVNDLLDFSRVESGSLHLDRLDFCPRECVEDVVQLLGGQAHSRGVELVCDVAQDLPPLVRGDPARLRQVLVNLVGNALKFTERGEVVVRVEATVTDGKTASFTIEVADTGIGIPRDLQSRIFESFVQLDASTTRRFGGAGLGLAISRHLVELMGGSISLQSEPGVGSTFTVQVVMEAQLDAQARGLDPAATVCGAKVLIVDDNDTNRVVLSNQLDSWRIEHLAVPNGSEALTALRDACDAGKPFSIAILDMQMPEMDGIALAGHIKADSRLQGVRLMLLTSAVVDLAPEELREAGFVQFTSKPVRQSQLYNCLLQLAAYTPAPLQESRPAAAPVKETPSPNFSGRVLLVEDNAINQEVARHMLESLGCEVLVAENGRSALERLEKSTADLILMDCQMPVMDGFETTEAVRARERAAGVSSPCPIIALTANALAGDREQCLAAGMDDYVSKPFKMDELIRVLTRWLPAGSAGNASSDPERLRSPVEAVGTPGPVLDAERLEFLRSMQRPGTPDLVTKVVGLYLDRSPGIIQSIADAVAARDASALQSAAHSLKSSSANLGATQVADAARQLERFGRECDLSRADDVLETLRAAYASLHTALEHHAAPRGDLQEGSAGR